MRLIHSTWPVFARKAIDARATAVQASEDAAETAVDLYRTGTIEFPVLLACLSRVADEQSATVGEVCQYNRQIADYAVGVAGVQITPQALVAMLILPAAGGESGPAEIGRMATPRVLPNRWAAVTPPSTVEPATFLQAAPEGQPADGTLLPGRGRPTLAPSSLPAVPSGRPPFPPKPVADPDRPGPAMTDVRREVVGCPASPPQPTIAPRVGIDRSPAARKDAAAAPRMIDRQPAAPRTSRRPRRRPFTRPWSTPRRRARVKHLAQTLHWNRSLPQDAGRPTELDECLRGLSGNDRHSVLDAYWLWPQRAAEYQVIAGQAEFMEQLVANRARASHAACRVARHAPALRRALGLRRRGARGECRASRSRVRADALCRPPVGCRWDPSLDRPALRPVSPGA